jgi:hypothetical protein
MNNNNIKKEIDLTKMDERESLYRVPKPDYKNAK